ncbi:hypothetical protein V6N13_143848 [Hibiscus sabdariffa]|uniref:Uncharacterized protein n=1 Tax=Hibiscus sabdariffa TaxID=183260 RepID=A0ABR2FIM6_9ROSI
MNCKSFSSMVEIVTAMLARFTQTKRLQKRVFTCNFRLPCCALIEPCQYPSAFSYLLLIYTAIHLAGNAIVRSPPSLTTNAK